MTQSQCNSSDVTEDINGDEEENLDWEISLPRKDDILQDF